MFNIKLASIFLLSCISDRISNQTTPFSVLKETLRQLKVKVIFSALFITSRAMFGCVSKSVYPPAFPLASLCAGWYICILPLAACFDSLAVSNCSLFSLQKIWNWNVNTRQIHSNTRFLHVHQTGNLWHAASRGAGAPPLHPPHALGHSSQVGGINHPLKLEKRLKIEFFNND